MATRGIDHRTVEDVITAYQVTKNPNWALFAGKEIIISYNGGDMEAGEEMLEQYLEALKNGGSTTHYLLKLYPDSQTEKPITNKTENTASTTIMLANVPTRVNEQGIVVLDRQSNAPKEVQQIGYMGMMAKIENMEKELAKERELRHEAQLKMLEDKFTAQISGLSAVPGKESWGERMVGLLEEVIKKPEIMSGWKDVIFGKKQDFIVRTNQVAGTTATEEKPTTEMVTEQNPDDVHYDIVMYNFLTPEEQKLKRAAQNKLLMERLAKLNEEQMEEIQNECLSAIEDRITPPTLTLTLLNFQALDDDDTNKLLNHMLT